MRNMKQFKKPFKNYCKRKDQRKKKRNLKEKNMFIDPIHRVLYLYLQSNIFIFI